MIQDFPQDITNPSVLTETDRFLVKLAENHEEVERAQRLRYKVFNLEQGRGLESAGKYGIDFDEFDEYCLHLLVVDKKEDTVVGTYRLHLGSVANSAKGFYSSREYEIKGIYKIADKCLELGRTCISPEYRNGTAIVLLWSAIYDLLARAGLSYMLGCVSLEGTDPRTGWGIYEYLKDSGKVCEEYSVKPRPGFKLKRPSPKDMEKMLENKEKIRKSIPPIFKGYLRIGGQICGEPAFDREFGTIDFFIIVDVNKMPERYVKHFKHGRM